MNDIPNYDSWKLESGLEDEELYCMCDHCAGEIYNGEYVYKGDDFTVHEDCFFEFAVLYLGAKNKQVGLK